MQRPTKSKRAREQENNSTRCNQVQQEAYSQLQREGIKNLFYLSKEELNLAIDSWVDYVHPSDYGMMQYAYAMITKIRDIARGRK